MSYRPQSAEDPTSVCPPGWVDEEFVYYFDSNNTPGLVPPCNQIPLQLQPDAEFHLRGIQISSNLGNLVMRLWKGNTQLSQALVPVDRAYSSNIQGLPPVGKLPVPVEPEVPCEAGSTLLCDLDLY